MRAVTGPRTRSGVSSASRVPEHLVQDLGVARAAERRGEPAELVAHRLGDVTVEERAVAGQRVPQPADRDPHVVHCLRGVVAHPRVEPSQGRDLLHEPEPDHVRGRPLPRRRLWHRSARRRRAGRRGLGPASTDCRMVEHPPTSAAPRPPRAASDHRPTSSTSASRQVVQRRARRPGSTDSADTRSSRPPRAPRPALAVQAMHDAVGVDRDDRRQTRWFRTSPATTCRRAAGGFRTARPSGTAISSRAPASGSLRCQPASSPPVRRRSTTPAVARARSGVSK